MEPSVIIPSATMKALSDKTNEKRKIASKEIEKHVQKLVEAKSDRIDEILDNIVKNYIGTNDFQMKKSGYIALAAMGLGLLQDHTIASKFCPLLLKPVLEGMRDNDTKIKFQSLESMFNIAKSFRIMVLPQINDIFKTLINIISDSDEGIKSIAVQLDSLLKDLVNEGLQENKHFDLSSFMPVLTDKMKHNQPAIVQTLISWIKILNSLPSLNLLGYIDTFLSYLLEMEGDNREIRVAAHALLNEFLTELKDNPKKRTVDMDSQIIEILIEKLIRYEKATEPTKLTAMTWLHRYLTMFDEELSQGYTNTNYNISILSRAAKILECILVCKESEQSKILDSAELLNGLLLTVIQKSNPKNIKFGDLIKVLRDNLIKNKNNKITISTILWMKELLNKFESEVAKYLEDSLELVIEKLNDQDDNTVKFVGDLLGKFTYSQDKFHLVIKKLLEFFRSKGAKDANKAHSIIKRLCKNMSNPIDVFKALTAQLLGYKDCRFISTMVQKLDLILLTDKDLIEVRRSLKNLSSDVQKKQENALLFESFYRTWCYNPISTLTICFLTQQYELSYRIIQSFSDFEFDAENLVQIAKLVQLLESPIFTYLRLQLLEIDRYPYLIKSLKGLMMLLPQGKAFNCLKNRLKNITAEKSVSIIEKKEEIVIDIDKMMNIFMETQTMIKKWHKENENIDIHYEKPIIIDRIVKDRGDSMLEITIEKSRPE